MTNVLHVCRDGRSKSRIISMFDSYFARLLLRIFKTTSTKLGRFGSKKTKFCLLNCKFLQNLQLKHCVFTSFTVNFKFRRKKLRTEALSLIHQCRDLT